MRKTILGLVFGIMISAGFSAQAFADEIAIVIDGVLVESDVSPMIADERTLVPVRVITESIGCSIAWSAKSKQIALDRAGKTVLLTLGDQTATIDGVDVEIDAAPRIVSSRTMVPLRFIAEAFGASVDFLDNTVVISTKDLPDETAPQSEAPSMELEETQSVFQSTYSSAPTEEPLAPLEKELAAASPGLTVTTPVKPGSSATAGYFGVPGATYDIDVICTGGISIDGLGAALSDESGYVSWTWTIAADAEQGEWPIVIYADGREAARAIMVVSE